MAARSLRGKASDHRLCRGKDIGGHIIFSPPLFKQAAKCSADLPHAPIKGLLHLLAGQGETAGNTLKGIKGIRRDQVAVPQKIRGRRGR